MEDADFELYKKDIENMPNEDLLFEYGENYVRWREAQRTMMPKDDLGRKGDMLKDEMLRRLNGYTQQA